MLNISIIIVKSHNETQQKQSNAQAFLEYVKDGDYINAQSLWIDVYWTVKSDEVFLDCFSEILSDSYNEYYIRQYKNKLNSPQLYEICNVYNSFIDIKEFNNTALEIYMDYLEEKINYSTFVEVINDFYFFTEYESEYISNIIEDAFIINESRINFNKALNCVEQGNLTQAIDLMKAVSPKDSLYYPIALEKIDLLIIQLSDEIKNSH